MQHAAAVSNHLHPAVATTSYPAPRRASWLNARARPSTSVKVRSSSSMRNNGGSNGSASTDSLDHLQRASMARQRHQQQGSAPGPRPRRVIHTTPFGLWDSFPEARTLDQMVRTMERIMDGDDGDGHLLRASLLPDETRVSRERQRSSCCC